MLSRRARQAVAADLRADDEFGNLTGNLACGSVVGVYDEVGIELVPHALTPMIQRPAGVDGTWAAPAGARADGRFGACEKHDRDVAECLSDERQSAGGSCIDLKEYAKAVIYVDAYCRECRVRESEVVLSGRKRRQRRMARTASVDLVEQPSFTQAGLQNGGYG